MHSQFVCENEDFIDQTDKSMHFSGIRKLHVSYRVQVDFIGLRLWEFNVVFSRFNSTWMSYGRERTLWCMFRTNILIPLHNKS